MNTQKGVIGLESSVFMISDSDSLSVNGFHQIHGSIWFHLLEALQSFFETSPNFIESDCRDCNQS